MRLERRISIDWRELSPGGRRCPEIWELDSGDYAVVGTDVTASAKGMLPDPSLLGDDESIVVIPRAVLESAKPKIP
jgi:hypothetical protein